MDALLVSINAPIRVAIRMLHVGTGALFVILNASVKAYGLFITPRNGMISAHF